MGNQPAVKREDNQVRFNRSIEQGWEMEEWFLNEIFSPVWHIGFKNFTQHHWKSLLKHVISCQTIQLSFKNINAPDMLTRIIHIKFDSLTQLKLNNLYLVSVQPLVHLQAPCLEVLEFSLNSFSSLKSLRKMHAPNLKKLQLYENGLVEADYLSECNFSSEMASIIMFNAKTKTLPENYNWLFKISSKTMNYFEYYNTQIIRNQPYKSMVNQKYPTCEIKLRYDTL